MELTLKEFRKDCGIYFTGEEEEKIKSVFNWANEKVSQMQLPVKPACEWTNYKKYDCDNRDYDWYKTSCGNDTDIDPIDNVKYCPYCGKEIK